MPKPAVVTSAMVAYRFRWKRKQRLLKALRRRRDLSPLGVRSDQIKPNDVLLFSSMRNEISRLPHFMAHYRELGVRHFLIVDNDSNDGTLEFLRQQKDVSVWGTDQSYRQAHYGSDWLAWLRVRYGHGHWCVTVDADEILIYPDWDKIGIDQLGAKLDSRGALAMGALMIDMYPKGPLNGEPYVSGDDPFELLQWFDTQPHTIQRQQPMENLWVQGGVRAREFFADDRRRSPTLNKLPLVKWNRRYAYINSTHSMLPRHLNHAYDGPGDPRLSGVLLHSKFLPFIGSKSQEEKSRGEHFGEPQDFDRYYDRLISGESLWNASSIKYSGWRQLVDLGLMSDGG